MTDVLVSGPTGGQALVFNGSTGVNKWQNTTFGLNELADVEVVGTPADGAVLVYSAAAGRWLDLNEARLDFIFLTTDDDEFALISQRGETAGGSHRARLDLGLLATGANLEYFFPNASGTFALQNQFTMSNVDGAPVAVPQNAAATAVANCPAGTKAIAVGVSALPPVTIQDMRIMTSTQVRVIAWRADQSQATNMNAVAYCMSQP